MEPMEQYQLNINYEGSDYTIVVNDLNTANVIINDVDAAEQFLRLNYPNIFNDEVVNSRTSKSTNIEPSTSMDTGSSMSKCPEIENMEVPALIGTNADVIWTKRKPTEKDLEATSLLLASRQKYHKEFDDKKTSKAKLWQKIATNLQLNSFNLGENAVERCRQKFANLTKVYQAYVKQQKTTGEKKIEDIPPFFDEIHSILGSKHKVNPTYLEDSFEESKVIQEGPQEDSTEEDITPLKKPKENENPIEDRYKNLTRKVKPATKTDTVLQELKLDRESREQEFAFLKSHLNRAEEQRDMFLNILEKAFEQKENK